MMSLHKISTFSKSRALMECVKLRIFEGCKTCLHTDNRLRAHQRSEHVGNKWRYPHLVGKQSVPMWKVHWLYMMKYKAELEGEKEPVPRSDELNWNYNAELSAFAHRLKIEVYADAIKKAFMEPIEDTNGENNEELYEIGKRFSTDFFNLYIYESFPNVGKNCAESLIKYLSSEELTSGIANNLGYRDLIQTGQPTVDDRMLHRCFFASVAAILCGPGGKVEAARFLNDFVVTDLLDKDVVHDIWKPSDPMKELVAELHAKSISPPEVRLTKQSGVNSVLPLYFIGLFCDQELLSESAGESVIKAEADAAKIALKQIYRLDINRYTPDFALLSDSKFVAKVEQIHFNMPRNPEFIGSAGNVSI